MSGFDIEKIPCCHGNERISSMLKRLRLGLRNAQYTFLIYKFLLTDIFDAVFLLVLKIVLKKHRFENQFLQSLALLEINQSMKF